MKEGSKRWLAAAITLILIGCMILGGVMVMLKWDFSKLATNNYETNSYTVTEAFRSISIQADTAEITLIPSESADCSVVCYERENVRHTVAVKDGTLEIQVNDTRKWYEHIGIHFGSPKITVSIPQGEYGALSIQSHTGNVKIGKEFRFQSIDISESTGNVINNASALEFMNIRTTTGSIRVENVSANSVSLSVSTGNITASEISCSGDLTVHVSTGKALLSGIACKNVISDGNTGDLSLRHVVTTEKLSVQRSTGDVTLDACDAAEIFIKTDTGDVTGSLLSEKIFLVETDTGRKEVPKTVTGGRCEIITDTGDIKIIILQQ